MKSICQRQGPLFLVPLALQLLSDPGSSPGSPVLLPDVAVVSDCHICHYSFRVHFVQHHNFQQIHHHLVGCLRLEVPQHGHSPPLLEKCPSWTLGLPDRIVHLSAQPAPEILAGEVDPVLCCSRFRACSYAIMISGSVRCSSPDISNRWSDLLMWVMFSYWRWWMAGRAMVSHVTSGCYSVLGLCSFI